MEHSNEHALVLDSSSSGCGAVFLSTSRIQIAQSHDPAGLSCDGLEIMEVLEAELLVMRRPSAAAVDAEAASSSPQHGTNAVMELRHTAVAEQQQTFTAPVRESCAEPQTSTSGASSEEMDTFISDFLQQYKEQLYLVQACNALQAFCQRTGTPQATLEAALAQQGVCLADLMQQAERVEQGLREIDSDDGWQLIQDSALRLLYRHEHGSKIYGFKAACTLPAPVENPLAMAREFDLISTWNRYMTDTSVLKVVAIADMLVYAALWMPWPFAQRDAVMHAIGVDLMHERGCLAISIGSPDKLPDGVELPAESESRQRIVIMPNSCLTLTPLPLEAPGGSQRTRADVVAYVDAKMPSVPEPIIQFVLRVFAPFVHSIVLSVLRKNFKKPEHPLPARMQQRMGPTQLYGLIRHRIATFLAGANATAC